MSWRKNLEEETSSPAQPSTDDLDATIAMDSQTSLLLRDEEMVDSDDIFSKTGKKRGRRSKKKLNTQLREGQLHRAVRVHEGERADGVERRLPYTGAPPAI